MFCRLGREKSGDDDTEQIRDLEGKNFKDGKERGKYIGEFYNNLYKKRVDNLLKIEDYLGAETCHNEKILNKKLTEEEKQSLEGEITLLELGKSLEKSNLNSAGGWDGVNYAIIKKYWAVLGQGLHKYTNEAINEGILGETFRRGLIKIIPKKGDAKKIGDWRPITLLCCGYKIISGAIANRLEKYLYKIIGRGQKGFLKYKNINSCSLNIIDSISQSMANGEKMGILCVDFSKAFDSIEHVFIEKTLKFFNFGDKICKMVGTILNKRISNVILGSDLSPDIKICRGTPQGDRTSPVLFIITLEILLLKIEADEGGEYQQCSFNDSIRQKNNIDSSCIEAYADDLTILFRWGILSLARILKIIKDFENVSGLKINVDKTQLMLTGSENGQVGTKIFGITVVDKIKVLGITIDRDLSKLHTNWEEIIRKMKNKINYWKLFKLSISGRVMVAKTYLVCQATYIMGSVPASEKVLDNMNNLIIDYINGKERKLARDRWFLSREMGGYGMFDLKNLDMCIKASWIKRWMCNTYGKDYAELRIIKGTSVADNINSDEINTERWRCSGEIVKKWVEYKEEFFRVGRNMLGARLFFNEMYKVNDRVAKVRALTGIREAENYISLGKVVVRDLLNKEYEIKDKTGMEQALGINITMVEFFRLRTILQNLKNLVEWRGSNIKTLTYLMKQKTRGSRGLRKAITGNEAPAFFEKNICELPFIVSKKMDQAEILHRDVLELKFDIWGKMFLKPELKTFSFRYIQGRVHVNQARGNFVEGEDIYCTFCKLKKINELNHQGIFEHMQEYDFNIRQLHSESVSHLFWQCTHVVPVINWVKQRLNIDLLSRTAFLLGYKAENTAKTEMINIILMWVKYWIYGKKIMKKIPRVRDIEIDWVDIIDQVNAVKKFKWI